MKRLTTSLAAVALSLSLIALPALARDITAAESAALQTRVDAFSAAFASNDMKAVSSVIPPKVVNAMAARFGMEPAQLIDAMSQAMEAAMQNVTIDHYAMDVGAATSGETSSGRPYFLIPTQTNMTVDGTTKVEATSQTLAFADEDIWYLVRIDDAQQVAFLTEAYPEFKGIDFPAGTTKILEN